MEKTQKPMLAASAYRPDIDGLRAIAIIPVLLFHAGVETVSGGFLGVDIFFVISGFLISQILFRELDTTGKISIGGFYIRRIKRIAPALFTVVTLTFIAAQFFMTPIEMVDLGKSAIATLTFVSNIFFWQSSSYFSAANELKPLLHTWSLSVEEQFYVFFPLFLYLIRRQSLRSKTWWIVAITLLSVILAEAFLNFKPVAAFFLLPTRTFELTIGTLAALALQSGLRDRVLNMSTFKTESLAVISLCGLVLPLFLLDGQSRMPGFLSLFVCCGAFGVCVLGVRKNLLSSLLSLPALTFIGAISYSLYLWHQPIFALFRIGSYVELTLVSTLALLALTFVLSILTWRYVEQPFRSLKAVRPSTIFRTSFVANLVLCCIAISFVVWKGFPERFDGQKKGLIALSLDGRKLAEACSGWRERPFVISEMCTLGPAHSDKKPSIMLYGDSHASALAPALSQYLSGQDKVAVQASFLGCAPAIGLDRTDANYSCEDFNRQVLQYLRDTPSIKTVIVAARWTMLTEKSEFNNGEGGHESPEHPVYRVNWQGADTKSPIQTSLDAIDAIREMGKNIIVVYPIPEVGWDVPKAIRLHPPENDAVLSTSYDVYKKRTANAYASLDKLPAGINRLFPDKVLCDSPSKRCYSTRDLKPLYYDDDHLSPFGAGLVLSELRHFNIP